MTFIYMLYIPPRNLNKASYSDVFYSLLTRSPNLGTTNLTRQFPAAELFFLSHFRSGKIRLSKLSKQPQTHN